MEREIQLEEAEHAKDAVIDVGLLNSMKEKLASTCAKSSPSFTICRVPAIIRHSDRAAYDPRIISIGPFHRGRKNLTAVEEHKWRYLQKVLSRSKPENDLEKYLKEMKAKEAQARNCYSENITIGSNEFVEMMVLDGCFVLQLIHEHNHNYFDKNDPIHRNDWMSGRIFHDMLLLENQLPFFVLECLWELIGQPRATLRKEALTFFRPAFPTEVELKCPEEPDHIHHLLHAVHSSLRPKPQSMSTATGKLSCLQLSKGMGKILPFLRSLVETRDMSTPTSQQSLLEDNPPCLVETRDTSTPTGQQSSLEYNPPCLVETRDTSTPPSQQSLLGASPPCLVETSTPPSQQSLLGASPPCLVETSTPPSQQSLLGASPPCLVETSTPTGQQSSLPPSMVRTIIPCARELQEAGLRFQRKQARSFIDVTFEKGWMEMPYLLITDDTNALFRNFIAFEQCFPECGSDFTTYCFLMDALVNTPRDVSILSQSNIIEHMLGSDKEVALLFNKLCKEIVLDPERSYLANVFEKVNRYTQENWPKWRAKLVHDYFSNPWAIISLIAAIILLIVALVQLFFTIYSYFRPSNS